MELKGLTSATGSAGDLVIPQRYPEIIAPPERVLRIRDLMTVLTTESNAIEYVEETGFTNNAAFVAEGSKKPESNLTFELKTESVKNIGHWIPASRQILNDVSQLRGYIDNRLLYGVKLAEEIQLLYGTGTGQNLQGVMTHPNVQTYKWSGGPLKSDTKMDALRRAITLAILAGYPATGIVLHPKDWEEIELLKGSDGKYLWVQVNIGGVKRLWALPIVDTPSINQNEACVGAFEMGAFLYDREQSQVRVAEQHEDFFIKGMVAILAEERLAQTIMRPESFVAVTLDHSPIADAVAGSGSGSGN
jgi:HK97 family phage major capsid protein